MTSTESKATPFGIRVSVSATDPFAGLVGADWATTHWYKSAAERDRALRDMAREHEYSRSGDKPTLIYEAITYASKRE